MLLPETELNFKPARYKESLPIEVCVTFSAADSNKRPFIEGKIVNPAPDIYDRLGHPATTMRCYCHSDISTENQQEIISSIEAGTTIKVLAQQPSTKYDGKAFGTIMNGFWTKAAQQQILAPTPVVKQTFTVSNMPSDLVERMDAKLDALDVKRTFFLKKLINKFLMGDFDADFV
jgi:hypothetical protein